MKLQEIIRNNYKFAGIAAASAEGNFRWKGSSAALSQQGRIFKFRRTKTKAGDIAVRSSDGGSAGGVCADAWNAREKAFEGRVIAFTGRRFF